MNLMGKTVLITGGARRVGRIIALAVAAAGADVILHHHDSAQEAARVAESIRSLGRQAWILQADLQDAAQAADLVERACAVSQVDALVNNAALFGPNDARSTTLELWQQHLAVNLTAPFLLSQAFASQIPPEMEGRILNILDWRALRPGSDHFAYTISKAALAALTRSLAATYAPHILVNGLALGAILPPSEQANPDKILQAVPAARWANPDEVGASVVFLLSGPSYITGEILHLDGGRHLL